MIITTEMKLHHSVECNTLCCDMYLTTIRRKGFQDFSFVEQNLSRSQCNFDPDTEYRYIQMDVTELKCAVVKYKFSDKE